MAATFVNGELDQELRFNFSRSSGPGGQHVNKVNTRVELRFDIMASKVLSDEQKELILGKLQRRLSKDGVLIIVEQTSRSQLKNKETAITRFYEIINKALIHRKKRKPTGIPKSAKEQRLKEKKAHAEKKRRRRLDL